MFLHRPPLFGFLGFSFHFPPRAARFCSVSATHFQQNQILDSLNCGAHSGALRPSRISKTDLVQSLNLGPIWQASDSLSPRAPGSARRPFLKFAPEPPTRLKKPARRASVHFCGGSLPWSHVLSVMQLTPSFVAVWRSESLVSLVYRVNAWRTSSVLIAGV